jgi:type VI secretion system protein ImpL
MQRLKRFFSHLWVWLLLAALLLCLIAWFIGPLIALGEDRPLAGTATRLAILLGIVFLWGVGNLLIRVQQSRANVRLVDALAERERAAAPDPAVQSATVEELTAIRHHVDEVLALLRQARFGRRWWSRSTLYQLPWYLVIGPPASGKTTALTNAGFTFPLAQTLGRRPVTDLGGTRNTDWWLTDDAVLIDTAGRYTSQDVQPAIDSAVWTGFLDLVKRHRPRQPINGALVVISPIDLVAMNDAQRLDHAAAIRSRLLELRARLGVRFPIYVLFSKMDLVLGFNEFFVSLGRDERAQVWGATFPLDDGRAEDGVVAGFEASFTGLLERLGQRIIRRLQEEADSRNRARILDLPLQLAALQPVMHAFLDEVFRPNRYEGQLLLRGFYLGSGTQAGEPRDLIAAPVAPAFGVTERQIRAIPDAAPGRPRPSFLEGLFRRVIFAEASLVGRDMKIERRRAVAIWTAAGAAALVMLYLGTVWVGAFRAGADRLEDATGVTTRLEASTQGPDRMTLDWSNLAATLDSLVRMPGDLPPPALLYARDTVADAERQTYRDGLERLLLPRLRTLAEDRLRDRTTSEALLYETLKTALMMTSHRPADPAQILAWSDAELSRRLPGEEDLRRRLLAHVAALAPMLPKGAPLDDTVLADARTRLGNWTLAQHGYDLLRQLPAARDLPRWRPGDHAGPAVAKAMLRPSGKGLWDGIDGLYTKRGFFEVVLPASGTLADGLVKESWVLSPDDAGVPATAHRVRADIVTLYLLDYMRQWDSMLADMVIVPFRSLSHAADVLNILSGPTSPLKLLLTGVAGETDLDPPPAALPSALAAKATAVGAAASQAQNAANQAEAQAGDVLQPEAQMAKASSGLAVLRDGPPSGHPVTEHFKALRASVIAEQGAPAPLDEVMKAFAELYKQVNRQAKSPASASALLGNPDDMRAVTDHLQSAAADLPAPVGGMVAAAAESGTSIAVGGVHDFMDRVWHETVEPACRATVDRRFPFDRAASLDAPLDDFTALLGPGGQLDQFFNTHLKPFVDSDGTPWRWKTLDGVGLNLPNSVLEQFERAARLRQALFKPDAKKPSLSFEIEPLKLDDRVTSEVLDIDGQQLLYRHGPTEPVSMQWPAAQPTNVTRLSLSPERGDQTGLLSAKGPFGLLHLLSSGKLVAEDGEDRYRLEFTIGGRFASFTVQASSATNGFGALPELEKFRCPSW